MLPPAPVFHEMLGTAWPVFLLLPLCTQSEDCRLWAVTEEPDGFSDQVWLLSLGAQGSQVQTEGRLKHGMSEESLAGMVLPQPCSRSDGGMQRLNQDQPRSPSVSA